MCKEPTDRAGRLCHGVQTGFTLGGNIPCPVQKQGELRVTAQSLPDVPHREQTVLNIQEGSNKHSISQETSLTCIPKLC